MSWFDPSGFALLAKSALKEAQKTFDRALELKDDTVTTDDVHEKNTQPEAPNATNSLSNNVHEHQHYQPDTGSDRRSESLLDYQLSLADISATDGVRSGTLVVSNGSSESIVEIVEDLSVCARACDDDRRLDDDDGQTVDLDRDDQVRSERVSPVPFDDPFSDGLMMPLLADQQRSRNQSASFNSTESASCDITSASCDSTAASTSCDITTASCDPASCGPGSAPCGITVSASGAISETAECLTSSNSSCHTLIAADWPGVVVRERVSHQEIPQTSALVVEGLAETSQAAVDLPGCSVTTEGSVHTDLSRDEVRDRVNGGDKEEVDASVSGRDSETVSPPSSAQQQSDSECPSTAASTVATDARSTDRHTDREPVDCADSPSAEFHAMSSSHTSVDGVETAASSDIEVIASPVGEARADHVTQLTRVPVVSAVGSGHALNLSQTSLASLDCDSVKWHAAKIAQLEETLAAREAKLVDLSRRNVVLQEENSNLGSRLEVAELKLGQHSSQTENQTRQLTLSLQQSKTHYQNIVDVCQREHVTKQHSNELLAEKDTIIEELRMEGEKLSKEQLKHMNIIKKLRAKEQENTQLVTKLESKLTTLEEERNTMRAQLSSIKHRERQTGQEHVHARKQVESLEKQLVSVSSERDQAVSRVTQLETSSADADKLVHQLQQRLADQQSELRQQELTTETKLQQLTREAVAESSRTLTAERDSALAQAERLRVSLQRAEEEHASREDALRVDIDALEMRLSSVEQEREKLSSSLATSSQPLLNQLQQLQLSSRQQRAAWERAELQWCEQRQQLQHQLQLALSEKQERDSARDEKQVLEEELTAARSRAEQLVQTLTAAEARVQRLMADLEQTQIDRLADREHLQEQYRALETRHTEALVQLEKSAREVESYRVNAEALRSEMAELKSVGGDIVSVPDMVPIVGSSVLNQQRGIVQNAQPSGSSFVQSQGSDNSSSSTPRTSPTHSLSRLSLSTTVVSELDTGASGSSHAYQAWPPLEPGPALFEGISAQLKLRDGELQQVRRDCHQLRYERDQLATEAAGQAERLQLLGAVEQQLGRLRLQYSQLEATHNTLLQVFGEKVEENDELRLDLADVKAMYRQQIDQLLHTAK